MKTPLLLAGVGLVLAALYLASPLTLWVLVAAPLAAWLGSRHLPADERRLLLGLLTAAFLARLAFVGVRFIAGLPHHNDLSLGALSGDESYYLSRALRSRDLMLGFATTKYDYFVTSDEYGLTSYVSLLTWLQVVFGPTPYSMRLVNALFFLTGATLLFREVRRAFGAVPAFTGLGILLFLPSLFFSSVSLLKESLYFLVASALVVGVIATFRSAAARRWPSLLAALAATAACLWLLDDLRRGALFLGLGSIGLTVALRAVGGSRSRTLALAALIAAAGLAVWTQPAWQTRALAAVTSAAKMHAGHVFTVGHAYKLLDDGFYKHPETAMAWDIQLTEPQALRFLVRGAASFLLTPLPWQMRSLSELAFMPEHVIWYLLLALLPIGVAAGAKQDALVTYVLIGFAVPTALVLAVTTGNVGTLLRLRGLVTPTIIWLSALGLCVIGERLLAARQAWPSSPQPLDSRRTAS